MRTPKESCRVVFLAVSEVRKKLYKCGDKYTRADLIKSICNKHGVQEQHIRTILDAYENT